MINVVPFLVSLGFLGLQFGGMDIALMEKMNNAAVVKYRVDGVHSARDSVVFGDYEAKADVADRVTLEFTWDNKSKKIVGPVTIVDGMTTLSNIKSDGTNCGPPQLKGDYEHFQTLSHSMLSPDQVQIKGTRSYPAAMVSNYPGSCSLRPIAGGKEEAVVFVAGVGPEGLGMPTTPGGPIIAAADRKSFSVKGASNWVWTYTPTVVK